jgi:surface protein
LDKFVPPPPPPPSPSVSVTPTVTPTVTLTPTPTPSLGACDLTYDVIQNFEFTIDTTLGSPNNTFTAPIIRMYNGTGTTDFDTTDYSYTINWGDGNQDTLYYASSSSFPGFTTHTYSTPGTYNLSIEVPSGQTFHNIAFYNTNNESDKKILSIDSWGDTFEPSGFGRMTQTLYFCDNVVSIPNNLKTSNLQENNGSLSQVFFNAPSFTGDVSNWVVTGVTALNELFRGATSFNQDLSSWDTSNITSMFNTFYGATSFDQSLSSWDMTSIPTYNLVGGVWSAFGMLDNCGMSKANYDATLIGWASQSVQYGVLLGANGLTYSLGGAAEAARNTLTTTYGWTITGDSGV